MAQKHVPKSYFLFGADSTLSSTNILAPKILINSNCHAAIEQGHGTKTLGVKELKCGRCTFCAWSWLTLCQKRGPFATRRNSKTLWKHKKMIPSVQAGSACARTQNNKMKNNEQQANMKNIWRAPPASSPKKTGYLDPHGRWNPCHACRPNFAVPIFIRALSTTETFCELWPLVPEVLQVGIKLLWSGCPSLHCEQIAISTAKAKTMHSKPCQNIHLDSKSEIATLWHPVTPFCPSRFAGLRPDLISKWQLCASLKASQPSKGSKSEGTWSGAAARAGQPPIWNQKCGKPMPTAIFSSSLNRLRHSANHNVPKPHHYLYAILNFTWKGVSVDFRNHRVA